MNEIEEQILKLKLEGYSAKKISELLNIEYYYVKYRCSKQFESTLDRKDANKKNEKDFEKLVIKYTPISNSYNHICNRLGLRGVEGYYVKIKKIIEKFSLDISHFGSLKRNSKYNNSDIISDDEFFMENKNISGTVILKRLIINSYKEWKCENCGITKWNDIRTPLQVHHINGNHYDNRLENLQLLCPNCHAQTDNFCNRTSSLVRYCEECNKELCFQTQRKFCSKECHLKYNKRILRTKNGIEYDRLMDTFKKANKASIINNSKLNNISKEELIETYKNRGSFLQVGKHYNVSDNAIRKLCLKYDLPTHSKDMMNLICKDK